MRWANEQMTPCEYYSTQPAPDAHRDSTAGAYSAPRIYGDPASPAANGVRPAHPHHQHLSPAEAALFLQPPRLALLALAPLLHLPHRRLGPHIRGLVPAQPGGGR